MLTSMEDEILVSGYFVRFFVTAYANFLVNPVKNGQSGGSEVEQQLAQVKKKSEHEKVSNCTHGILLSFKRVLALRVLDM